MKSILAEPARERRHRTGGLTRYPGIAGFPAHMGRAVTAGVIAFLRDPGAAA